MDDAVGRAGRIVVRECRTFFEKIENVHGRDTNALMVSMWSHCSAGGEGDAEVTAEGLTRPPLGGVQVEALLPPIV